MTNEPMEPPQEYWQSFPRPYPPAPYQSPAPSQPVPEYAADTSRPTYDYGAAQHPSTSEYGSAQHPPAPAYAATQYLPPVPPAKARPRWRRRLMAGLVGCAVVIGAAAGGYAVHPTTVAGLGSSAQASTQSPGTGSTDGGTGGGDGGTGGAQTQPSKPQYNDPFSRYQTPAQDATAAQQIGVVDINTVLGYQGGRAAGTGMVLTSDGEILTNNHVVQGATAISATVVSTGKKYDGTVVGTAPTFDVAVLRLKDASGLQTIKLGDSSGVKVGDSVVGVGNAGGDGGTPGAAEGKVTALDQSITATDSDGSDAEHLTGLIGTDAPIEAGDSGGPLYNAAGDVIGMNTAAQTSRRSGTVAGYAIPIDSAEKITTQIESGEQSETIHIGLPGFIGVTLGGSASSAAVIGAVVPGLPADKAGISAGDTVTAVDGTTITTAESLQNALSSHSPGQRVTITWKDEAGASHSTDVTLDEGPAD